MGSPTMSTQSPQTGGKSGQAPVQAGGKGFGGGGFQPENSNLTQDMLSNLQQPNNQQTTLSADPSMPQPMSQDMLGSALGQSTNNARPVDGFNPNNLPQSSMTGNLGGLQQNSLQQPMAGQQQMGLGKPTQAPDNPNSAGGKGMAGPAMNAATSGMGQGNVTYPSQSGQPVMGMPNAYSNTVGQPNTAMTPTNSGDGMPGGKGSQQNGKMGR